jgi:hypothetical protein
VVCDIPIASAHSSEPFLVLKSECRLDAKGCIYLAASSVDLVKSHKVGSQMDPGRAQVWRT